MVLLKKSDVEVVGEAGGVLIIPVANCNLRPVWMFLFVVDRYILTTLLSFPIIAFEYLMISQPF